MLLLKLVFRGKPSSNVSFCLIDLQNSLNLLIQCSIDMVKPVRNVLMYRGFADTEFFCSSSHGGLILNHEHSQIARSLFHFFLQIDNPLSCVFTTAYARENGIILRHCALS